MKKWIAMVAAMVMLVSMLPLGVLAFDPYTEHNGQNGCRLTSFSIGRTENPWLMQAISFKTELEGRVWVSTSSHPNILGQAVKPVFRYEGTHVTFNGETVTSGETAVTLKADNDLVVYNGTTKAEYQICISEERSGLPVVLIDTNNASIPDKVNYVDTKITVLGSEVYGGKDIYAAVGGIKLRGNSTMGYDKKPYRIKFDKKQDVFGLGKAKSWVLLANYLDPARMRNDIAYSFGSRLAQMTGETSGFVAYVPRTRPVEVYLNGVYKGLYDMGDHVQVDGTRLDIDESGEETDDYGNQLFPEGNVGYYLEIEDSSRVLEEYKNEGALYFTIENTGGYDQDVLYVQVKTPEIASATQLRYIEDYVQTVNNLIRAKSETVWNYIDKDSFIDWYLVNETFKNTDSGFLSSVKLYKDKDGKLCMGPVWDFDLGAGAVAYSDIDEPNGWRTRVDDRCDWYVKLFEMSSFSSAVNARWKELHDEGVIDGIFEDIDGLTSYLEQAALRDYALWFDSYINAVNNTGWLSVPESQLTSDDWEVQVQTYRSYMKGRIAWLDAQFGYKSMSSSTIGGEVTIIADAEYRETLTAGTLAVTPFGASVRYQWYANGAAISGATSATYTPSSSDIGKEFTVKVTGRNGYSGTLTSAPVTLKYGEKTSATTQVPPLMSFTHNSVTVLERTGYDISIDGGKTWQTSGVFENLSPNTLYRVIYRHKENIDYCQPGVPGKPLYVITAVDPAGGELGDIDLSGAINMVDAFRLYAAVSKGNVTDAERLRGDMNGDGSVNTSDAFILYKRASGR